MPDILVGTYNMSFAGDQGLDPRRPDVYESEAAFHLSNPGDPRQFWKNAADFVFGFWQQGEAGVLGLQEMNLTAPGSGTGSDYIESTCKMIRPSIRMETQHIDPERPGTWPALSILWDSAVFGDKIAAQIYKLDYMPEEAAGGRADKSRPILFVYTTKGYLLCCLHGPNSDILSRLSHQDMKTNIDRRTLQFLSEHGSLAMNPEKMFFMGDFNDRYDAINSLVIQGVPLTYAGKAPYSCCHNWDSSCSAGRYDPIELPGRGGTGTCRVLKADGSKYTLAGPGPREPLGPEGNIENYRYTGDKVFGLRPSGPLQMFPPGRSGPSRESDHEMVIGRFTIPAEGAMGGAGSGGNTANTMKGRRRTSFRRSSRKVRRNRSRRSHSRKN